MEIKLEGISLPDQHGEVVVSTDDNRVAIHRAVRSDRLRKLAPRAYPTNLKDSPEKIVRSNCWAIAGALFLHALISDPAVDRSELQGVSQYQELTINVDRNRRSGAAKVAMDIGHSPSDGASRTSRWG